MNPIEKMRKDGYPRKIIGNSGYPAYLYDIQPLFDGDYLAVYQYPGGQAVHDLTTIKNHFTVLEP